VRGQQFESLDEEGNARLPGARLGRLFDVRVHHLAQPDGVDRVLVCGVEAGSTRRRTVLITSVGSHTIPCPSAAVGAARACPPGRAAGEVEDTVGHR
jgi:hypothetical protein